MKKILFLALLLLVALPASAATLSVSPSATSVAKGDLVTARILVNTQGVAVNNAEAVLQFPASTLSVVSVTKTSSIFTLWVAEPTFSNSNGTISFNGGLPTPGYTGAGGTVLSVTFLAKQPGTATLSLSDAAVRANDGLGTNVLTSAGGAQITVAAPAAPAAPVAPVPTPTQTAPVQEAPAATGSAPGKIAISSPTHPDEDVWYADAAPTLRWTLPKGAESVQLIVDASAKTVPSVTYKPAIVEKTVSALGDGAWYFNLRYKLAGTWSPIASYRLHIDATAPVIDDFAAAYDDAARSLSVTAAAHDDLSGITHYELQIDKEEAKQLPEDAFAKSAYEITVKTPGKHTATLRAFDRAGNSSESAAAFSVETSVMDTPVFELGGITIRLLPLLLIMIGFSLLSLLAALLIAYAAYRSFAKPAKDRAVARQKVHKAFSLLRSDLDKQVRAVRKARTGKELSDREEMLATSMSENISDLEKYIFEQTDILK